MLEVSPNGTLVFDTPKGIEAFRLLALKGALKLETLGLRASRGYLASVQVRKIIGSKTRNKEMLLQEYLFWLRERGILRPFKESAS